MGDNSTLGFMPKNIRQIGHGHTNDKVYIEDYVMTYLKQLSDVLEDDVRVITLIGHKEIKGDVTYTFVNGVVELREGIDRLTDLLLNNNLMEITRIKEDFYGDKDIVGLAIIQEAEWMRFEGDIYNYFVSGLVGDTVIIRDGLECEQVFKYENNQFNQLRGYYVYYERNESMQNYMLCMKDGKSIEYGYSPTEIIDKKVDEKIRSYTIPKNTVYSSKINPYDEKEKSADKRHLEHFLNGRFRYMVASLLAIALLIAGVMKVDKLERVTKDKAAIMLQNSKEAMGVSDKIGVQDVSGKIDVEASVTPGAKELAGDYEDEKDKDDSEGQDVDGDLDEGDTEELNGTEVDGDLDKKDGEGNDKSDDQDTKSKNEREDSNEERNGEDKTKDASVVITEGEIPLNNGGKSDGTSSSTSETVETSQTKPSFYIVKRGDALVDISRKIYGTHKKVADIKRANGLEDEDKIFIGQKLIMP